LRALAAAAAPTETVLALRDAGRGTLYYAVFGPLVSGERPTLVPAGRAPGESLRALQPTARPSGEDALELATRFGLPGTPQRCVADAAAVLAVAEPRFARAETVLAHDVLPRYLQASAPERKAAGEVD
ncbi:MAG: hypothetical protein O2894_07580, partial [Planctomycetota bacterium]|nr:hypothetical protein [Planctomycetota bacterium]